MHGLRVVNGCQSLNTILSCSETVKKLEETFVMFRFYEIPQRERADRILNDNVIVKSKRWGWKNNACRSSSHFPSPT
jgi:hypothetical protein